MIGPRETQPSASRTTRYCHRRVLSRLRKQEAVTQASSAATHSMGPAVTMMAGRGRLSVTAPSGRASH